jgi:hypothetical protein
MTVNNRARPDAPLSGAPPSAHALSLLYRGPLSSCNYSCGYCPFAAAPGAEDLRQDQAALERFVAWVRQREGQGLARLGLLFAPRGEALIHPHYQHAAATLSRLHDVASVTFQTNLSGALTWLDRCDPARLALWTTFHPGACSPERFLAACTRLDRAGVRYSVGVVGLPEHLDAIEALRHELPETIYLWVNAFKRQANDYTTSQLRRIKAVDPHVAFNLAPQPSLGRPCRAGHAAAAVSGDGSVRRCFFTEQLLGNLYEGASLEALLAPGPQPCPEVSCRCHIGYVHLEHLGLQRVFGRGPGLLARIPL